jgi:hypothetical protein
MQSVCQESPDNNMTGAIWRSAVRRSVVWRTASAQDIGQDIGQDCIGHRRAS